MIAALPLLFSALALYASAFAQAASLPLQSRAPAAVITRCTVSGTVALTFDDGPYIYLNEIVDTLKKAGAKGTFFFNGNNWGCIYSADSVKRVKYAYDNGFQVASHTWAHKHLNSLSSTQVNDEMAKTEQAIRRITGASIAFTRPPYGEYNDMVRTVASQRNQTLVNWDFDSGDAAGKTVAQQKALYDDVAARHPNTILSLQHEVKETTARDVLPYAINRLQSAGYKLVTLAECLGQAPYHSVGSPSSGSWQC